MNHIDLTISIQKPFGNLFRKRCVLIAAINNEGKCLLGAKSYFFPPTITRLLGGGVDDGEDIKLAAVRELTEELGITITPEALQPMAIFTVRATDQTNKIFDNNTHVFSVTIGDQKYTAGDDVTDIVALTPTELLDLSNRYDALPETLWYNGPEGTYSWADYAKMYGPIHREIAHILASKPQTGADYDYRT